MVFLPDPKSSGCDGCDFPTLMLSQHISLGPWHSAVSKSPSSPLLVYTSVHSLLALALECLVIHWPILHELLNYANAHHIPDLANESSFLWTPVTDTDTHGLSCEPLESL